METREILHRFPVQAAAERVFAAVSTAAGLNAWWTKTCSGRAEAGGVYELGFGPEYAWRAEVTRWVEGREIEWTMQEAMEDWMGTRVGFVLEEDGGTTWVEFRHTGWRENSEHLRGTSYCWALYLRLLRRYVECGEVAPYERRLD